MFRRSTVDRGRLERDLLGLVDAAVALQPRAEAVMAECIDRSAVKRVRLAHMVAVVQDGYAFLLGRLEGLPCTPVVEEVKGLVRYHHLLVTTTATHFFNTIVPTTGVDDRFSGRLGEPAARLRSIRAALVAHVDDGPRRSRPDVVVDESGWARLVGMIDTEPARLGQILDNVLSLALLEEGDLEVSPEAVDARDVVAVAVDQVSATRDRGEDPGPRLTVPADDEITPGAACRVWADRQLAVRALVELVDNAVRHAGPDARVEVCVRAAAAGVEIAVIDDGVGFPRSVRDRMAGAGPRGLQRGIGIPTAAGLAAAMGGDVSFDEVGRGTRSVLRLPAAPAPATP